MDATAFNFILQHSGDIFGTLIIVLFIAWVIGKTVPAFRKTGHVIDDAFGEPARKGVPARPGWGERLTKLENTQDLHGSTLTEQNKVLAEQSRILGEIINRLDIPAPTVKINLNRDHD